MALNAVIQDEQALAKLVARACEAPLRHDGWQRFLDLVARQLGCNMGVFMLRDPRLPEESLIVTAGLGEEFDREFRSRYGGEDDYWLRGMTGSATGTVRLGTDIISLEEMRRTRVYRELAAPWQIEYFLGSVIINTPEINAHFSLTRSRNAQPFTRADQQAVTTWLLPHLHRSITLHGELTRLRSLNSALVSALDQAPYGAIFLDPQARLLHANQRAGRVLESGEGLSVVQGKLLAADPSARQLLDEAICGALLQADGPALQRPPAAIRIKASDGATLCRLVVFPLAPREDAAGLPSGAACMVLVHDERRPRALTPASLMASYKLSPGEARLAAALFSGQSLPAAADALGITRNTAKSHLSRIFDKTGARSQSALLKLLALGPALKLH